MATIFSGLNPNPLSDVGGMLSGESREPHVGHGIAVKAPKTDPARNIGNPAEESIEPIQVETLPPPTKEPQVNIDNDEWAAVINAVKALTLSMHDRAPTPMPYADETASPSLSPENVSAVLGSIGRSFSGSLMMWALTLAPLHVPAADILSPMPSTDPSGANG
jgi:hypothetical protein